MLGRRVSTRRFIVDPVPRLPTGKATPGAGVFGPSELRPGRAMSTVTSSACSCWALPARPRDGRLQTFAMRVLLAATRMGIRAVSLFPRLARRGGRLHVSRDDTRA
jgi:hypothetical protein